MNIRRIAKDVHGSQTFDNISQLSEFLVVRLEPILNDKTGEFVTEFIGEFWIPPLNLRIMEEKEDIPEEILVDNNVILPDHKLKILKNLSNRQNYRLAETSNLRRRRLRRKKSHFEIRFV